MDETEHEEELSLSKITDSPTAQRSAPETASLKSDNSIQRFDEFKHDPQSAPETASLKSDNSIQRFDEFKHDPQTHQLYFSSEAGANWESSNPSDLQQPTELDSVFKLLEEDIFIFVRKELKKLHKILSTNYPEYLDPVKDEEDSGEQSISEAFLKITVNFMKRRKQKELAERLWTKRCLGLRQHQLKLNVQQNFQCMFEGLAKAGSTTLLKQIYTDLYITEGEPSEVNQEHEIRYVETASRRSGRGETPITCEDIFKGPVDSDTPIRTVLTKGVAGIGKTVLTQKFSLDWAEGKANQDIQLLFPFAFRKLNVVRDRNFSLVQLVHHFFGEIEAELFEDLKVVFIFDGLDECRIPLDFTKTKVQTDPTECASLEVLLVNLIRGNLLSSARIWITTRPAAASQIPTECISIVTEVRGFNDLQKDQYFGKRFLTKKQADAIIAHIKASRSLLNMCHMPIFCWILSTVLEHVLTTKSQEELPKTLTQMFIHFLVVQAKVKNMKYEGGSETDPPWTPETRKMVQCLGKLAFEQLMKGNLIFYDSDLSECGLDAAAASVYSGVFTQVFREESGLYQNKVYCFIHLSIQEFLAALHVHLTFVNTGVNLLSKNQTISLWAKMFTNATEDFYRTAVDQALQSPNGKLDLFLRFLLGLSQSTNQMLLRGLLTKTGNFQTIQKTSEYIKQRLSEDESPERCISLLHCLNELNDCSLLEQIQQYLNSGRLSEGGLSPAQWSALAFVLLSSEEDLDRFELKKYSTSEGALLRLLPVLKASSKAMLSGCNLSERSCEPLASVLRCSSLRVLDFSNNDLKDSGLQMLSVGLKSSQCKLEQLNLSGCLITEEGCASLASALRRNPTHLRDLDMSYNHPGDEGVKLLTALQEDSNNTLNTLRLEPAGAEWLTPGFRKYFCELTLDPNTAHRELKLSNNSKDATRVREEQPYADHQDRFEFKPQLLCSSALSGRCYWEVQWSGEVHISVAYSEIPRKGFSDDSEFGYNDLSWCLVCSERGFSVWHDFDRILLPHSSSSGTVGVYVDCPAGSLTFYMVSSNRLIHLHTFNTTFTHPLLPGFRLWSEDSSVSLCVSSD